MELLLKNLGDESMFGGKDGDLRVDVNLRETHSVNIRGADIISQHFVTLGEAIEGKELKVRTTLGEQPLVIPEGSFFNAQDAGHLLTMSYHGGGFLKVNGQRGSHIAHVLVRLPSIQSEDLI